MTAYGAFARLDEIATEQHGLLTLQQIRSVLSERNLTTEIRRGTLIRVGRGVYRLAGSVRTWRQRALAACLSYGPPVALSHRSAAALFRLEGVPASDIEVTVPPTRSGRYSQVRTYRMRLPASAVTECDRIPVTTPARTLVDLAPMVDGTGLGRLIDDSLRRRLLTLEDLDAEVAGRPLARKQRVLRAMIRSRSEQGVGDSHWEDIVLGWVLAAGLPMPVRQFETSTRTGTFVLDLAWPDAVVAAEFQGFGYHGRRHRFDRDQARITELALAGWIVVLVTSAMSRDVTVDRIRRALAMRKQELLTIA